MISAVVDLHLSEMLRSLVAYKPGCSVAFAGPAAVRWRSVQAQPASDVDPEWANALPYEKIPQPGVLKMLRGFAPGGEMVFIFSG